MMECMETYFLGGIQVVDYSITTQNHLGYLNFIIFIILHFKVILFSCERPYQFKFSIEPKKMINGSVSFFTSPILAQNRAQFDQKSYTVLLRRTVTVQHMIDTLFDYWHCFSGCTKQSLKFG
jgi:hypothetical protein